jgi:hypothetical protein
VSLHRLLEVRLPLLRCRPEFWSPAFLQCRVIVRQLPPIGPALANLPASGKVRRKNACLQLYSSVCSRFLPSTFHHSSHLHPLHHLLLQPSTFLHPSANIFVRSSTTFATYSRSLRPLGCCSSTQQAQEVSFKVFPASSNAHTSAYDSSSKASVLRL